MLEVMRVSDQSNQEQTRRVYLGAASLSMMPLESLSASSSTAALDCAHTRIRGEEVSAELCPLGTLLGIVGPLSALRLRKADASATMVLVLPVPGGPCTTKESQKIYKSNIMTRHGTARQL